MLIAVIVSVVVISGIIGISAAPPPNAQEKISTHVTNDNAKRALQVFDISEIQKGSQITSVNAIFNLISNVGDDCILILNEPHLNKDEISDPFVCSLNNTIPLKIIGVHTLQTKLNAESFNIEIKSITSGLILSVPSRSITIDTTYLTPTNFAKIENGIVTNIIVADQSFVDTLRGTWIDVTVKSVGIGYTFDPINNKFISPQPYPSWILVNDVWKSPVSKPTSDLFYNWNESSLTWDEMP